MKLEVDQKEESKKVDRIAYFLICTKKFSKFKKRLSRYAGSSVTFFLSTYRSKEYPLKPESTEATKMANLASS